MRLLLLLLAFVLVSNHCRSQTSRELRVITNAARSQGDYAERERAAVKAGEGFFGKDKLLTAKTEKQFRGTLAAKKPPAFMIGDWGYTKQIFEVLDVISDNELLVLPIYKDSNAMLVRGLPTKKVTTGSEFIMQYPVKIEETYSYTTINETRETVLILLVTPVTENDLDDKSNKKR